MLLFKNGVNTDNNRQYTIVYLDPLVNFLDIVVVLEALDGRPLPRVLLRQRPRRTEVLGE